ncbi:hypothetical protein F6J84_11310 [Microbacterium caowuchunii]|uniref:SGNH/GDSL hydrolase family protein n=1 Tax=Microbacterium caowuchunii TaxID=2614638 RepID=UPI0012478523|nr:SGNH/GDSL hydrolase family protein [Microbacterium caowuchunii]QEW00625.1 hypothetical protein F6J84_11310 [Microbacterium caowuchunii]
MPLEPAEPLSVVVYGDSNTTGFSGALEAGMAAGVAWPAHLPPDEYELIGGWAVDGITTTRLADTAVPAPDADLLVVMGGTNDIAVGTPTDTITANVVRIADVVAAPRVALAAIPPLDPLPEEANVLNTALAELARTRGWEFVDPWAGMRDADGTWMPVYRTDGVHTTADGYARAGEEIGRLLSLTAP